jgi:hypothetical protein
MHVQWRWSDTHEDDGLSSETELFNRLGDAWEPADGSGGASWFDPPFCRPSSIGPRDALVFGGTGSFDDGRSCYSIEGIAGSEAAFVEVVDLDGTTRRPIECPFGAFIACSDGARVATLRVFDRDGDALLTTEFSTGLYGFPDPPR